MTVPIPLQIEVSWRTLSRLTPSCSLKVAESRANNPKRCFHLLSDPEGLFLRKQQGMKAWQDWVNKNETAILDNGSPLGKTKRADAKGISDTSNAIAAYTIVQAESHEAAAKLFENHPHFTIFPGDAVEIMECLPIPGGEVGRWRRVP